MEDNNSDHSSDVIIVSVDEHFKKQNTLCQRCHRKKKQTKKKTQVRREITFTRIVFKSKESEKKCSKNNQEKHKSKTAESKDRTVPKCFRKKCRSCFDNKQIPKKEASEKLDEKNTIQVKIFNKKSIPSTKCNNKVNQRYDDLRKLINNKSQKYEDLRIFLNNRYCRSARIQDRNIQIKKISSVSPKQNPSVLSLEDIDSSEPFYEDISSDSLATYVNDDLDALIKRTKEREKKNVTTSNNSENSVFDKEKDLLQSVNKTTKINIAGQDIKNVLNDKNDLSKTSMAAVSKKENTLESSENDAIDKKDINMCLHFNKDA